MSNFHRAARSVSKLRLALCGPSGAGKTYSALLIASGIVPIDKVAVIDTENGSADLYANFGPYAVLTMRPPYTPQSYINAIHDAENEGFELIIVDSLTHAWSGEGGLLDQQGKATDSKYKGNSWAAWREITPLHNKLVETMLRSSCHIIATMRSKTEYVQQENNGRKQIVKVGMAPIQRDGMEYEFTVVFDISIDHVANVSKDRTDLFNGQYFVPNRKVGETLKEWLNGGGGSVGNNNFVPAGNNQMETQAQQITDQQQQQAQNPAQQPAQQVNSQQQSTQPTFTNNMSYEVLQYVWHAAQWPPEKLFPYIEGRWKKPLTEITGIEMDTLANELCEYAHMDRKNVETQIVPF